MERIPKDSNITYLVFAIWDPLLFLIYLEMMEEEVRGKTMIQKKSTKQPDEMRQFDKGNMVMVRLGDTTFGKATFEPGWKWSESVKPIAKTDSCEMHHTFYQIAGKIHVVMDDGTEEEFQAGDVGMIPPGHDAWVVGDEPVVMVDISGMDTYAKKA